MSPRKTREATHFEMRVGKLFDLVAQQYVGGVVPEKVFYAHLRTWLKPQFARALVRGLVLKGTLIRPAPGTLARVIGPPTRFEGTVSRVQTVRIPRRKQADPSDAPFHSTDSTETRDSKDAASVKIQAPESLAGRGGRPHGVRTRKPAAIPAQNEANLAVSDEK